MTPLFRAGQAVCLPTYGYLPDHPSALVWCRVICPLEGGNYLLRLSYPEGYVIAPESDLETYTEVPQPEETNRESVRIVFFGNGDFAAAALLKLIDLKYNIVGVVTAMDSPKGRGGAIAPTAVKSIALTEGIAVYHMTEEGFIQGIESLKADIGVVADFCKLPRKVFTIPRKGCINLHSSLLPQYRGASTIFCALRDGKHLTGVTTFAIDDNIDTGRIINNYGVYIGENDTATEVYQKLKQKGVEMIDDAVQYRLSDGVLTDQDMLVCDWIQPSHAPKLRPDDRWIEWSKTTDEVHNFVRALSPTPAARTQLLTIPKADWVSVKILRTAKSDRERDRGNACGRMFSEGGRLYVYCSDGVLEILRLQIEGRKPTNAADFLNGLQGDLDNYRLI